MIKARYEVIKKVGSIDEGSGKSIFQNYVIGNENSKEYSYKRLNDLVNALGIEEDFQTGLNDDANELKKFLGEPIVAEIYVKENKKGTINPKTGQPYGPQNDIGKFHRR